MAKRSRSKRRRLDPSSARSRQGPPVDLDELWQRVRSGAANVAGVRYQLAVTAYLLAAARTPLAITKLVPEGLEDVDCELVDGAPLLIQTKDRAEGDGRFGPSELRAALAHAAHALRLDG